MPDHTETETDAPISCPVCGEMNHVEPNHYGPMSFAGAVSGIKHTYTRVLCPHRDEDWHRQARQLLQEAYRSPSARIATMMVEEAAEVIRTRQVTKKGNST